MKEILESYFLRRLPRSEVDHTLGVPGNYKLELMPRLLASGLGGIGA
jgi:TPP-dependent 2-oxoacid decarboxylase